MQALNAVAHYYGTVPSESWSNLLRRLSEWLGVPKIDYQFQATSAGIAEKVNQIKSTRARIYFMRIINDVYRLEMETLTEFTDIFGSSKRARTGDFQPLYNALVEKIRCD